MEELESDVQHLRMVTDRAVELLAERETVQRFILREYGASGSRYLRMFKLDTQTGNSWIYSESQNQMPAWIELDDYQLRRTNDAADVDWANFPPEVSNPASSAKPATNYHNFLNPRVP